MPPFLQLFEKAMVFGALIAIELHHDRVVARNVRSGATCKTVDHPDLFPPAHLAAAFGHPRLIVADLVHAERIFTKLLRMVVGGRLIKPVVVLLVHHRFADTITPVELRALLDASERGGARRAHIWRGPPLSDDELLACRFPAQGLSYSSPDELPTDIHQPFPGPTQGQLRGQDSNPQPSP